MGSVGLHRKFQKRDFTSIPYEERARSLQTPEPEKTPKETQTKIIFKNRTLLRLPWRDEVPRSEG